LFQRSVEYIQIDLFPDTGNIAHISMLPEVPWTFIFDGVYVIVGNPVGVSIEYRITKIAFLEFIDV